MIALRTAIPRAALRGFVRVFAQREVTRFHSGAASIVEPIPARLEQTLEFQFGVPFTVHHARGHVFATPDQAVVGAQVTGVSQIDLGPGVVSFAVFFTPTGFSRLFGVPVNEMSHRNHDAAMLPGKIRALRDRLGACATFELRVQVMEEVLLALAARARERTLMARVADHVFARLGVVRSVERLAADAGLGIRQFQRLFIREIGIAPRLYARVTRFQNALDFKIAAPGRSWLEIAHRLNYHDQMHMIRDFLSLGGDTPRQLLAQIGDGRPGAVAEGDTKEKHFAE